MDTAEYHRLARVENSHWWYRSMHQLILNVLKGLTLHATRSDLPRILDAGCGTGGLTRNLATFGAIVGMDISQLALSLNNAEHVSLIQGSVNAMPLRLQVFDIITSISVLYHRQVHDEQALKEFHRVLKKDGYLIVILPAFRWAIGSHDHAVHTKKRYTLVEAKELIKRSGFSHISGRYIFSFLFPLFVLKRMLERFSWGTSKVSDLSTPPRFINIFFELLCKLEWVIEEKVRLPFGSSLLITAQK